METDAQKEFTQMMKDFIVKIPLDYNRLLTLVNQGIDINKPLYPSGIFVSIFDPLVIGHRHAWSKQLADAIYFFVSCGVNLEPYDPEPKANSSKVYLHYLLFTRGPPSSGPLPNIISQYPNNSDIYCEVIEDLLEMVTNVNRCSAPSTPSLIYDTILYCNEPIFQLVVKHPSIDLNERRLMITSPNGTPLMFTPMEIAIMVLIKWVNILHRFDENYEDELKVIPPILPNLDFIPPPKPDNPPLVPEGILVKKPFCPQALRLKRSDGQTHTTYTEQVAHERFTSIHRMVTQLYKKTGKRPHLARLYYLYEEVETVKSFDSFQLKSERIYSGTFSRVEELLNQIYESTPIESKVSQESEEKEYHSEELLTIRMLNGEYLQVDNKEFKGRSLRYLFKHIAKQINQFDQDSKVYSWQLCLINKDGVCYKKNATNALDNNEELCLFCSKIYIP